MTSDLAALDADAIARAALTEARTAQSGLAEKEDVVTVFDSANDAEIAFGNGDLVVGQRVYVQGPAV